MALKGSLRDFSLTQLLNLIRLARKTGALTIYGTDGQVRVFCRDGRLVHVSSKDGQGPSLAEILVKKGRVTTGHLAAIRPYLTLGTDKELALRLLDLGLVSQEDIIQAVREQMLETLFPVFSWTKGSFLFDPQARFPEDEITVSIDLESIVLEGGRRLREFERLQQDIPSLDVVPRLSPQLDARRNFINLTADQWKAVSFVNGRHTLRQIGDYAGFSEFQTRKIFQELLAAGLVEISQPRVSVASVPKRPVAVPSSPPPRSLVLRLIDRIRGL